MINYYAILRYRTLNFSNNFFFGISRKFLFIFFVFRRRYTSNVCPLMNKVLLKNLFENIAQTFEHFYKFMRLIFILKPDPNSSNCCNKYEIGDRRQYSWFLTVNRCDGNPCVHYLYDIKH